MMTDLLFTRWLTLKIAKRQLTSISLDRLASNLPDEAVKHTSEVFKDDKFKRRKKKGAYPYDYINSVTKFDEKLLEKISTATFKMNIYLMKYKHSQSAWNTFNLSTMGEYRDLYLKSDILLLGDVWKFQKDLSTVLQTWSMPLFYISRTLLGCSF